MKVFIQSIVGQLLLNPYILWRGYQALPQKKYCRIPFVLFFVIELSIFFFGFFFRDVLPDDVMIPILYICGTWYIASLYITLSLLALELLRLTQRIHPWFPRFVTEHWQRAKLALFLGIAIGVAGLMLQAYHTVTHPIVKDVYVTIPKRVEGRDSLKIVLMSDLHIGEMIGKDLVRKYVALSNAQKPDMVVLAGDIMDYESRFAEKAHIEEELRQLRAPLGVYIVNGNHEYRANWQAKRRWLRKTGGTLLIDSVVQPDSTFYLIGRDDFIHKKRKALHALMEGLDTSKPIIVADHQPWSFAEMRMNGVDLGLHGHTHNGQLWPYPLLMKLVYECPYGYYRQGPTQHYVSSGIGIAGPPYRVGTVSELVVLHLRFN